MNMKHLIRMICNHCEIEAGGYCGLPQGGQVKFEPLSSDKNTNHLVAQDDLGWCNLHENCYDCEVF